jgi:hypothetical protein
VPTIETTFEVVGDGRIYRVRGDALERWIAQRRQSWQAGAAPCSGIEMMMAIVCAQAQRCRTNDGPTGVATNPPAATSRSGSPV